MIYEDIVDVLSCLGVEHHNYNGNGQLTCSCPLAEWMHERGSDSRPSMSIKVGDETSVYKCFACGESGTLASLVTSYGNLARKEDIVQMGDQMLKHDKPSMISSLRRAVTSANDCTIKKRGPKTLCSTILNRFLPAYDIAESRNYLEGRGVSKLDMMEFELLYDPSFRRIVFPIRNEEGSLVGAVGRSLGEGPKFYNYFGFEASKCLGGIHRLSEEYDKIILVEGMFDVIKMCRYEGKLNAQAVCTFKAEASGDQCDILSSIAKPVIVCYDGDMAGYKGANKTMKRLNGLVPYLKNAKLPEGGDVDSVSYEDFTRCLKKVGVTTDE